MRTLAPSALLALAACAVGPDYAAPAPDVPSAWSGLEDAGESRATARRADLAAWWTSFGDPVLDGLVARALASGLDLRLAAARVREARALRGAAAGALLPDVGAGAGYARQRWSENGVFPTDGDDFGLYDAGFDAAWEIDVFGGNRRRLEAAGAELEAAVEGLRDVRVTLLAELSRGYVELRALQQRIAVARRNVEAQRRTAELTRSKLRAGQISELDVAQAEAQASATASDIPALEAAARRATHAVAVLLGRPPAALAAELAPGGPVPAAPAEIPAGLPADLLRRRPDVRRAERELAAATARVGVATADLYPRFFLTGAFGVESVSSDDLFTAASRTWSFGPSIRWPIFQGGRIRANIEVQDARQEQAAIRFEQTLLGALRDVEDALVAHGREQARRALLREAVASRQRAVEIADERYRQGLVDVLSVLDAQRGLYSAQDALLLSEMGVATQAIAIYKALGGGWSAEADGP